MTTGCFVAFEGIDGSGKTTLVGAVAEELRRFVDAFQVLTTAEPWSREWVDRATAEGISPADAYDADRGAHLECVVCPALEAGRIVLCDRYYLSTVANQGGGGREWEEVLEHQAARHLAPDLWVVIELAARHACSRVAQRDGAQLDAEHVARAMERGDRYAYAAAAIRQRETHAGGDVLVVDGRVSRRRNARRIALEILRRWRPAFREGAPLEQPVETLSKGELDTVAEAIGGELARLWSGARGGFR